MIRQINQVTKHVKIPQIQKIDVPVVMQRQVPQFQAVLKTGEARLAQFIGKVDMPVIRQISQVTKHVKIPQIQKIDVPVVMQRQVPQFQAVLKTGEARLAQFIGKVDMPVIRQISQVTKHVKISQIQKIDVPVVMQRQVPQFQAVLKTGEARLAQFIGKVDMPVIRQISQVTKHVKIPQIQKIDVPVVMQRQVPQFQAVLKTGEARLAQFIGKVDMPVIRQISQVTKRVKIPQIQKIDVPVVMQRQVPQFQTVLKTGEARLAQFIGKVVAEGPQRNSRPSSIQSQGFDTPTLAAWIAT